MQLMTSPVRLVGFFTRNSISTVRPVAPGSLAKGYTPIRAPAPPVSTRLSPSQPLTFQSTFSKVVCTPLLVHWAGLASLLLLPAAFRLNTRLPTASCTSMALPLTAMASG